LFILSFEVNKDVYIGRKGKENGKREMSEQEKEI